VKAVTQYEDRQMVNVSMAPVFVVEDEADIARLIGRHLESAGFPIRLFGNAIGVLAEAQKERPSLFVLDILLPGCNGLDLCRQVRQDPRLSTVPVIFVTAKTEEVDRVLGLELGADDYITKPFSPRELVARVKAVLRRFEGTPLPAIVEVGEIEIDSASMTVRVRGNMITTTATEFRLLEYLARYRGRAFSRDQLLDAVWRDTAFVTPRSVDVYVRRLREKIERNPDDPEYIRTLRGTGYRFEVPKYVPESAP
jgi:DNA-binding response OmpR family regulator